MIDRVVEHFREGISNDGQHIRPQHSLKVELHGQLGPHAILIAAAGRKKPGDRSRFLGRSLQAIASASGCSRSDDLVCFEQAAQMEAHGLPTESEVFTEFSPVADGLLERNARIFCLVSTRRPCQIVNLLSICRHCNCQSMPRMMLDKKSSELWKNSGAGFPLIHAIR